MGSNLWCIGPAATLFKMSLLKYLKRKQLSSDTQFTVSSGDGDDTSPTQVSTSRGDEDVSPNVSLSDTNSNLDIPTIWKNLFSI